MPSYTRCPECNKQHEVKEAWSQATRYEDSQFLGEYILCVDGGDDRFGAVTIKAPSLRFAARMNMLTDPVLDTSPF